MNSIDEEAEEEDDDDNDGEMTIISGEDNKRISICINLILTNLSRILFYFFCTYVYN